MQSVLAYSEQIWSNYGLSNISLPITLNENNDIVFNKKAFLDLIVNAGEQTLAQGYKIYNRIKSAYSSISSFYKNPKKYLDKMIKDSARLHPAFFVGNTMMEVETYIKSHYEGAEKVAALNWLVTFGRGY